jgi:hypothetical protein
MSSDRQQAVLDAAASAIASTAISDYYAGSWVVIATLSLNGDYADVTGLLGGDPPTAGASTMSTVAATETANSATVEATPVTTLAADTTTVSLGSGSGGSSGGCCTWDRAQGCQGDGYCNQGEQRCTGCGGTWIGGAVPPTNPPTSPPVRPPTNSADTCPRNCGTADRGGGSCRANVRHTSLLPQTAHLFCRHFEDVAGFARPVVLDNWHETLILNTPFP